MPDLHSDHIRGFGFHNLFVGLRDGRAGWAARCGMSLAAGVCTLGILFSILGGLEMSGTRIRDAHAAIFIPSAIVVWLAAVYFIWATFGRWKSMLRTVFTCLIIWAIAIGASILLDSVARNSEMAIGGVILLAATASIIVIVSTLYQLSRGRPVLLPDGKVNVNCPSCGYNMSGLDSSACPECGSRFTLDQLIRGQNYEGVRATPSDQVAQLPAPAPASPSNPMPDAQPVALPAPG